jgi:hypothetical protein
MHTLAGDQIVIGDHDPDGHVRTVNTIDIPAEGVHAYHARQRLAPFPAVVGSGMLGSSDAGFDRLIAAPRRRARGKPRSAAP